jgi:hypothetical protein
LKGQDLAIFAYRYGGRNSTMGNKRRGVGGISPKHYFLELSKGIFRDLLKGN